MADIIVDEIAQAPRRKRGRPKGSRNSKKVKLPRPFTARERQLGKGRMARTRTFTLTEIRKALQLNFGNPRAAAAALVAADQNRDGRRIDSYTISRLMDQRADLQKVADESRRHAVPLAENVVLTHMRKGDGGMARWFLEQQAKHLGYGLKGFDLNLLVLDPRVLTDEQLKSLLDPDKLSVEQINMLVEFLQERIGGPLIDVTPGPALSQGENQVSHYVDNGLLVDADDEGENRELDQPA